ncbi:hypothetical protein KEM52_002552 [Ascosphaera acerosa]|nr:hypothetical protein KEM52_002552 [Ascosphaera acerosa]
MLLRIRLRPKLVLQVQQVSNTPRPIPKLDVLPSNYFGSLFGFKALRMLNVAFSRCGPADVVVVPSDSYMHAPAEEDENQAGSDEESEHRELVAAITMPKREESGNRVGEICLARGSRWDATALPNGNYEFVSTSNGIKTVARWVLRRDRRKTDPADSVLAQGEDTRCYTFSIIDPTTRRHPVIGWLNSKGVDVADRYSPAAGLVKQSSDSPDEDAVAEEAVGTPTSGRARPLLDMDDFTRTLIVVSSIFVSLREGWAKNEPLSGPESQPVSSELGPVAVPSPAIVSMRSTESSRGSSLRVARRRSSQISSLLERTSVAFRRSLSLTTRSSRPSSARRNFDPETISKMSSRRSSVLSDGNNMRPIFREVQPLRRSDTISNAQLSRAGQSYLLTNDDAGINASGYDRDGADSYAIMSDPEGDALDTYHGHASTAHRDRGCSPSPEPSSSGNEAAEFIHETVSGPHGRGKKKWRKLGHWLKPKKGKKDDPSQA